MDYSYLQSNPNSPSSIPYIPLHRTQLHPRMYSFPSPSPSSSSSSLPRKKTQIPKHVLFLFLTLSLLTLPFLFLSLFKIHTLSHYDTPKSRFFGITINAGVSVSQIRVFEFVNEGMFPSVAFDGSGTGVMKFRGAGVQLGIGKLVEFAKGRVPRKEWGSTRVVVVGSSELGLEGLEDCRRVLRKSGFLFRDDWAVMMQGEEEGIYAWTAVNYVLGNLGSKPQDTTGIIELGGRSLQVVFASGETKQVQSSRIIKLAGNLYNLHTLSFPQFGQDVAWDSFKKFHSSKAVATSSNSKDKRIGNPCFSRGCEQILGKADARLLASYPSGNYSACKMEASSLLRSRKRDKCVNPPCQIPRASLLQLQGKEIIPENFFYSSELIFPTDNPASSYLLLNLAQFFGMFSRADLVDLMAAGQHYCEIHWDTLSTRHAGIDDLDLLRYCFTSAYTLAILQDGLGISLEDESPGVGYSNGSLPLDWTLGAFVMQAMQEILEPEQENFDQIVGNESVTHISLFAILLIVVLAVYLFLQWQKPQLKTIYDLEKGHYIITRIPR